ncbi:MAG TPA: TolC family protein, partial [Bdellovibrio sp.]
LSREGHKVGARTNTDVLDAEAELFRAKAGAVNAQIGALEAVFNLELSTGIKLVDLY